MEEHKIVRNFIVQVMSEAELTVGDALNRLRATASPDDWSISEEDVALYTLRA